VGPSGDVFGRSVVDSCEDLGEIRCLSEEILKNAKRSKMGEFGLDFRRVRFVSLVGPSGSVMSRFPVVSCEYLVEIRWLGVEILKKLKKSKLGKFGFDFRRAPFVSLV
jgi:hypothetical protein